jgi:hypothetical protein
MASTKRHQYAITLPQEMKERMNRLPVTVHRSFTEPMRAHLDKLLSAAEKKQSSNEGK